MASHVTETKTDTFTHFYLFTKDVCQERI